MGKYETLVRVLDELRGEAPSENKRYHPNEADEEKLNYARSRAFIHLFLKGKYGLCDFKTREEYITDDAYDGGIDAYYIDAESKTVIFIQSKFRTNEKNFEQKEISYDELLAMETDRIIDGEEADEDGHRYNSKILKMMRKISRIEDIGRYSYKVVILANLKKCKPSELKKLVGGFSTEVFDFEKCYTELVFPIVAGCFFKAEEIKINLSLANKEGNEGRISYTVNTELSDCKILVTFVPLIEIAKILYKYKNSILKYNPRCFLGLKNNEVNPKIESTVKTRTTNEFALFNNGITILSDDTQINSQIALKDRAQLIITNPQIINGGQTSFTLASIYESCLEDGNMDVFNDKEVLVKVITFIESVSGANSGDSEDIKKQKKLKLIEDLSRATNEQSTVSEVDRRSNERVLINYQKKIYDEFGYFLNRKKGEFHEGLHKKYISRDQVIDPTVFMRVALSVNGDATKARRNSDEVLFREANFTAVFLDTDIYRKYMFGYMCYLYLVKEERKFDKAAGDKYGVKEYGYALRYGKYAVVNAVSREFDPSYEIKDYEEEVAKYTKIVLAEWKEFENEISSKWENADYFYQVVEEGKTINYYNYDGYYKGRTLNGDLSEYEFI